LAVGLQCGAGEPQLDLVELRDATDDQDAARLGLKRKSDAQGAVGIGQGGNAGQACVARQVAGEIRRHRVIDRAHLGPQAAAVLQVELDGRLGHEHDGVDLNAFVLARDQLRQRRARGAAEAQAVDRFVQPDDGALVSPHEGAAHGGVDGHESRQIGVGAGDDEDLGGLAGAVRANRSFVPCGSHGFLRQSSGRKPRQPAQCRQQQGAREPW